MCSLNSFQYNMMQKVYLRLNQAALWLLMNLEVICVLVYIRHYMLYLGACGSAVGRGTVL